MHLPRLLQRMFFSHGAEKKSAAALGEAQRRNRVGSPGDRCLSAMTAEVASGERQPGDELPQITQPNLPETAINIAVVQRHNEEDQRAADDPSCKAQVPQNESTKRETTSILATIDVGFGHTLFVRGEGAGLNWNRGLPMRNRSRDTWEWKTREATVPFRYKVLIDDAAWAEGADCTAEAGKENFLAPAFGKDKDAVLAEVERQRIKAEKEAARTAWQAKNPDTIPALIAKLGDVFSDSHTTAVKGLRRIGIDMMTLSQQAVFFVHIGQPHEAAKIGAPAVEPLIAKLDGKFHDVREAAAEALGEIGDARAVEPLIARLGDRYPDVGRAAAAALRKIDDKVWCEGATSSSSSPGGATEGRNWTVPRYGIEMVWIAPGNFMMGSPENKVGEANTELQHYVTLTKGYWLGKYEVTQGHWQAVMRNNPSNFKKAGINAPVEQVSWNDAVEFCIRLTQLERAAGRLPAGYGYTLPTEAQWEYACRAGSTGAYGWDGELGNIAWYKENSAGTTRPVGLKQTNAWGLYDMHGNVFEWCADWHVTKEFHDLSAESRALMRDDYLDMLTLGPVEVGDRPVRGGCFEDESLSCQSWHHRFFTPDTCLRCLGFRLALTPIQ